MTISSYSPSKVSGISWLGPTFKTKSTSLVLSPQLKAVDPTRSIEQPGQNKSYKFQFNQILMFHDSFLYKICNQITKQHSI